MKYFQVCCVSENVAGSVQECVIEAVFICKEWTDSRVAIVK